MEEKIDELYTWLVRFRAGYSLLQEYLEVLESDIEELKRNAGKGNGTDASKGQKAVPIDIELINARYPDMKILSAR